MRALLVLLFIPLVSAQGGYDPSQYDDYGQGGQNGCIEAVDWDDDEGDEVDYEYAYVCNGRVQAIDFHFETGTNAHFSLEAADVNGGQRGSVSAVDLRVGLASIVEFVDTDGDDAYTPGEDTVVNEDPISGTRWSTVSTSETSDGVRFTASYNIAFGGRFKVTGTANAESYRAGSITVQPTDTKVDFELQDISYSRSGSHIALVFDVDGESADVSGTPRGPQSGEAGVAVGGSKGAYFTWAKTADVDGQAAPVRSVTIGDGESATVNGGNVRADEFSGTVTLAYARGTHIVHDPRLGAAFNEAESNDSPMPWALLPLLAVALLRRR